MSLSVVVPVYNESATIRKILSRLKNLNLQNWTKEVIIIDDGSSDGTQEYLLNKTNKSLRIYTHKKNRGKGAAIRTGISHANGDYIIIQDADLEYDPSDIRRLLAAVEEHKALAVYGTRFKEKTYDSFYLHRMANFLLTSFTNILYQSKLSDMETCYKLIQRDLLSSMDLEAERFEFEPEVTAKLLKRGVHIFEVSISYSKRGYSEGKKITIADFFEAIWTLLKYRFVTKSSRD